MALGAGRVVAFCIACLDRGAVRKELVSEAMRQFYRVALERARVAPQPVRRHLFHKLYRVAPFLFVSLPLDGLELSFQIPLLELAGGRGRLFTVVLRLMQILLVDPQPLLRQARFPS